MVQYFFFNKKKCYKQFLILTLNSVFYVLFPPNNTKLKQIIKKVSIESRTRIISAAYFYIILLISSLKIIYFG